MILYILFAVFGYLFGSVRFSYLIPKFFCGVDVTVVSEDHNPGTANAMKYAGVPVGVLCLMLDMGKGFLPVFFGARFLNVEAFGFSAIVAVPVLGHCFPVFHGFRGGKAVAVSFGVLIGLMWNNLIVFVLVFWYLFMCMLRFVRPNEKKSVFAFSLFTLTTLVFCILHWVPVSIFAGILLGSAAAIFRNAEGMIVPSIGQEQQRAMGQQTAGSGGEEPPGNPPDLPKI